MKVDGWRVLIVGSGAREHALARAIGRSARVAEVVVAPGNAGIPASGRLRRAAAPSMEVDALADFAAGLAPDLVVVGPEAPLCDGLVDALAARSVLAFGPTRAGAALEGSKVVLKEFAARHGIPTASFDVASTFEEAAAIIARRGAPIVVKADGLCAGKGVVVAATEAEALDAARAMLVDRAFGDAGARVVLEACLVGEEASVHAICDGERLFVLPAARDHKRIGDGDVGPNTGGMGVVAPSPRVTPEVAARIDREILRPTLAGLAKDGVPFRGVLFAGLMIDASGAPMLLEYNVRFGDPECEALMALLDGDVAELLASAALGHVDADAVTVADRHAAVVILAAAGYPQRPRAGDVIEGIDAAEATGAVVHHAGTATKNGALLTAGGRVLAVTAVGATADEASDRAYAAERLIRFEGKQRRGDIRARR